MVHWGDVIEVDWETRQVRVGWRRWKQRLHHGPFGIGAGAFLLAWGLTDLHDIRDWFRPGPQLEVIDRTRAP